LLRGQTSVDVTFTNTYDQVPLVNATMQVTGTAAQKQAILNQGYSFAVTDITQDGFTIQLDKAAATNVNFSWVAIQTGN